MLLVISIGIIISIMHASTVGACIGLLVIISNISIFLTAKVLLYLLLMVIPGDLVIFLA